MIFPIDDLIRFYNRSGKCVRNAVKNSRNFANVTKYDEIEDFVLELFVADVHFYGSRVAGIGTFRSDLDIYIDVDDSFVTGSSKKYSQEMVQYLKEKMKFDPRWNVQIALTGAAIPVLRCYYIPRRLKCEFAFSNGLSVVNSELMKHLFNIQPEAKKLFHFIRIWMTITDMRFKRYQLTLLVIFFLQTRNLLPSIQLVQKRLRRKRVMGWDVQFDENRTLQDYSCKTMLYFKDHLTDFFDFYSLFDFDNFIVFPHFGRAVPKCGYPNPELLRRFMPAIERNQEPPKMTNNYGSPMVVVGLLSINYNVTYNVGTDRLKGFINCCRMSKNLLCNNI